MPALPGKEELEFLEDDASEWITILRDVPVYEWPDSASGVVGQIHGGKHVVVTGTTPHFARVHLMQTGAKGYVPIDAVNLIIPETTMQCYTVISGAGLMKYPNAHSAWLGEVGSTQIFGIGEAFRQYDYVRTPDMREGYLRAQDVFGPVRCLDR